MAYRKSRPSKSSKNPFCSYCKENGHWMRDRFKNITLCPKLQEKEERQKFYQNQNRIQHEKFNKKNKYSKPTRVSKPAAMSLKPENIFSILCEDTIKDLKSLKSTKSKKKIKMQGGPKPVEVKNQNSKTKSWVQVALAPPSPSLPQKPPSPKRVKELKEEKEEDDKLPTPNFLKSLMPVKNTDKEISFKEMQNKFSLTDGGWGSSDNEM